MSLSAWLCPLEVLYSYLDAPCLRVKGWGMTMLTATTVSIVAHCLRLRRGVLQRLDFCRAPRLLRCDMRGEHFAGVLRHADFPLVRTFPQRCCRLHVKRGCQVNPLTRLTLR